jgi:predicted aldo/keto reductase-like oxidoreductase
MKTSAIGLGAAAIAAQARAEEGSMPTRPLGKTGEQVSIIGVGGHHIGRIKEDQESIGLMREAIDLGATFLDNAWEYHQGRSEELMGRALQDGYREKAFLMTKHHGRDDKAMAMKHLEDSLRRLRTDVIDLWQFHEVVYKEDPRMIFAPGGAIEAAEEAKQQGKVRYIGFTGHKDPAIFMEMLAYGYDWDAVQMPINVLDAHFRSFRKEIVPILQHRDIGVIGMKSMASGHVFDANVVQPAECLQYALSQPVSTIVSGMNTREMLRQNVALAKGFTPLSEDQEQVLLAKTHDIAMSGKYEPFKTTRNYDGPIGRAIHGVG